MDKATADRHELKIYTEEELNGNLMEPDKLKAIAEECCEETNITLEEFQERYAFKRVLMARWIYTYICKSQYDEFNNPAIGYYLDRYPNEVNSLMRTANNRVPGKKYYRDMMFNVVMRLEDRGFKINMPTNLVGKLKKYKETCTSNSQ